MKEDYVFVRSWSEGFAVIEGMWQVLHKKIKELDASGLDSLMCSLLREESCASGARSPSSQEKINTPDGGCDCLTFPIAEGEKSRWLEDQKVCWQFKSGANFSSQEFNKELNKKKSKEILIEGGYYILCLSGYSGNLEDKFLKKLPSEFSKYKNRIKIYGMENIADFCVDHLATMQKFLNILNFKTIEGFDSWSDMREHDAREIPWEGDKLRQDAMHQINELFDQKNFRHVHIRGESGVGKTRFALEVCRGAKWKKSRPIRSGLQRQ